jgi:hypothetical protein
MALFTHPDYPTDFTARPRFLSTADRRVLGFLLIEGLPPAEYSVGDRVGILGRTKSWGYGTVVAVETPDPEDVDDCEPEISVKWDRVTAVQTHYPSALFPAVF